ncbi:hypothetical protein [uncultured Arcticibacterium sp.]|uniref:hypothetical protein n=1 Tax=uncultured Arcticibacterium sp. TaxID=2173042 RepID=UPI0030FAD705
MKHLTLPFILIATAASAQIPYSHGESLIKSEEAKVKSYTVKPLSTSSTVVESSLDNMPILFPGFKVSMMLEVLPPENMPNPLIKEEE